MIRSLVLIDFNFFIDFSFEYLNWSKLRVTFL